MDQVRLSVVRFFYGNNSPPSLNQSNPDQKTLHLCCVSISSGELDLALQQLVEYSKTQLNIRDKVGNGSVRIFTNTVLYLESMWNEANKNLVQCFLTTLFTHTSFPDVMMSYFIKSATFKCKSFIEGVYNNVRRVTTHTSSSSSSNTNTVVPKVSVTPVVNKQAAQESKRSINQRTDQCVKKSPSPVQEPCNCPDCMSI